MIMSFIWFGIFILSLLIEFSMPALVSLWFAVGGLASLILSLFVGNTLIWLQVVVFILVTVLTLVLLRPFVFKNKNKTNTNVDSYIDKIACCTEDIVKYSTGSVKIEGLIWTAILDENEEEPIKSGDLVKVKAIDGNKLIVKKYEEKNIK